MNLEESTDRGLPTIHGISWYLNPVYVLISNDVPERPDLERSLL